MGERPTQGGVSPELAVALGAATQAGILEGSVTQVDVFTPNPNPNPNPNPYPNQVTPHPNPNPNPNLVTPHL